MSLVEGKEQNAKFVRKPPEVVLSASEFQPTDGGWGWVVCLASFWTNGTLFGTLNSFGILFVRIIDEFKDKEEEDIVFKVSWIGALQIALTFFLSPIVSIFVDRVGIRPTAFMGSVLATAGMVASSFAPNIEVLYLTYGVCLGAGSSFVYTPSMVILGHYFKKRLGMVNGFVSFGSAVFTIILPFVMEYTLNNWGLRWTLRLLSCMLAVLLLCSLVWKPQFSSRPTYQTNQKCTLALLFNMEIWKNKGYRVLVTGVPICFLGYFVPFVHLVKHTKDVMPHANPMILVMCLGATSGVSRLVCGKISDLNINRVRMKQLAFFVLGVCSICIPFAKDFGVLVAIVLIMGIWNGCFICLLGRICFDLLGPEGAAQGMGCLLGLTSIPMTLGPPMAGLMYDYMNSYTVAFFVAGAPPIIGATILFLMPTHHLVSESDGNKDQPDDTALNECETKPQLALPNPGHADISI